MNESDLWQDFESSGSVSGYLRYKSSQDHTGQSEKAGENRADGNNRIGTCYGRDHNKGPD